MQKPLVNLEADFDPHITGYSARNAIGLATVARLAYQMPDTIAQTVNSWGNFPHFHFFSAFDTQAYLIGNDDLAILAFRGTQFANMRDWMTNAKILLTPGGGGKVHCGFAEALNWIWPELITQLPKFRQNQQRLLITGHSLGGALATYTAAKLRDIKQPVDGVYTFGSPRVGDKKFADGFDTAFAAKAFRFVNNNDLVTRVAPRSLNYSHVGRCLYFDVKGQLQDDILFWQKFLDAIQGTIDDFLKPGVTFCPDHDMGRYEKNLLANSAFQLTTDKPRWVQTLL